MTIAQKIQTALEDLRQFLNNEVDISPEAIEATIETLESAYSDLHQPNTTLDSLEFGVKVFTSGTRQEVIEDLNTAIEWAKGVTQEDVDNGAELEDPRMTMYVEEFRN